MPASRLLLACLGEIADALEITNDASHIVDVLGMAVRTFMQIALVDGAAVVADGVGHVEGEVVATFARCHLEQLAILLFGEMLLEIHVESRTAREVLDIGSAMELELLDDVGVGILDDIEIAVVAVTRNEISVFPIPLGMLHAHILGWYHLAVEEHVLGAIELVVFLDKSKHGLHKLEIVGIVGDLESTELCRLYKSVDTDGEILARHIDISCVEEGQHAMRLKLLEILVVCQLHLMTEVDHLREILLVVDLVVDGILDAAVEIDGEHALRTGGYASGTEGVAESVVLNFVAQTAAR